MSGASPWVLGRDRLFLAGLTFGLAVLTLTGWGLFGGRPAKPGAAKSAANTPYTHLHCPDCKAEFTYSSALEGKACPECESETGLVPTTGSTRDGTATRAVWGKVLAGLVVVLAVVPGLGVLGVWRLRVIRRLRAEEENRPLLTACPFCARRVSYPPQKIGEGYVCSRCKTAFVLPAPDAPAG